MDIYLLGFRNRNGSKVNKMEARRGGGGLQGELMWLDF